jgi:mono/diheme cytochrome c family protein
MNDNRSYRGASRTRELQRRGGFRAFSPGILFSALLCVGLSSCEWFTDFKRQPSLWTWEPVKDTLTPSRGNPQMSVPVTGMAVAGFQVSYAALPGTIDSMSPIPNPHPASPASLLNGRKYFSINCAVCHGDAAMGDGPATKYGMPGINLTSDVTKSRTDGYIFGMIRNGRGLMPPYNRIEEPDRWDVVNYLRALQSGGAVEKGPLAAPGVTGDKLPGATQTAPTRPAPFVTPGGRIGGSRSLAQAQNVQARNVVTDSSAAQPAADSSTIKR